MLLGIGYGGLRGRFILNSPYSHLYDMKAIGDYFVKADETTAEAIISLIDVYKKPIIPVVDQRILEEDNRFKEILKRKGILLFPSPLRGAIALSGLVRYGRYVRRERYFMMSSARAFPPLVARMTNFRSFLSS